MLIGDRKALLMILARSDSLNVFPVCFRDFSSSPFSLEAEDMHVTEFLDFTLPCLQSFK